MEVQRKWEKHGLIKKVQTQGQNAYWLLDGPPYPNAEPHMGHVRGLAFKDALLKMRSMQGRRLWIKPGFDCHGLPIENKIEQQMGVKSKDDIESRIGVPKFMEACRQFATANVDIWMDFYRQTGIWFGWERPYYTLDFDYMDSAWWAVAELWKQGKLKTSQQPFHWCPHCQTVLSGYEVTDEYRDLEDPSVLVKFPAKNGTFAFLVWTTTPWTLPGNVALVVRGDAEYVRISVEGEAIDLVLARDRLPLLDELGFKYEVKETFPGKKLKGTTYAPLIPCKAQQTLDPSPVARQVYLSVPILKQKVAGKVAAKKEVEEETLVEHFTNLDDGTGIVHCAPGHGPEDFELGKVYSLPALSPVNETGSFTDDVENFKGKNVKRANSDIVEYLKSTGKLFHSQKVVHRYPVCWRCKAPLIFRMTEQWVIDVPNFKQDLLKAVEGVTWQPDFAKQRMLDWVANAKEWTISRQRYWNIPMPVWKCPKGHLTVVSGAKELEKLTGQQLTDLHRDKVDSLQFSCPECGEKMSRISDVLDVWFDSGAASFAVLGYPKDKSNFKAFFPTEWVEEGQDHIRGWFYYLLAMSVALFGKAPYQTVNMHGWVVDAKGEKMSKSKGNFITARQALGDLGPDVLRFYILSEAVPWESFKYQPDRAKKNVNQMLNVWRNLNTYLVKYVELEPEKGQLEIEDKWLLSRLHSTLRDFRQNFETYNLNKAMKLFRDFLVEDLSRIYMKLAKERVKKGDATPVWVLQQAQHALMRLMAPFLPFITEEMYETYSTKFGGQTSVYLEAYPEADRSLIKPALETGFSGALKVVEAVLARRDEQNLSMKVPLPEVRHTVGGDFNRVIQTLTGACKCEFAKDDACGPELVELTCDDFKVWVNDRPGEEHLLQGDMREVARRVQMFRKQQGLKASDRIRLKLSGDACLLKAVKQFESEFRERVGADEVVYTGGQNKFKIGDKIIMLSIK